MQCPGGYRRIVCGMLGAAILALPCWQGALAVPMFPDVPQTHWAYDAVRTLAEKGIIEGYPAGPAEPARPGKSRRSTAPSHAAPANKTSKQKPTRPK